MSSSLHKGYSVFHADPTGVDRALTCRVCGTRMDFRPGVEGPTGFAMAMARQTRRHDVYTCSHATTEWHAQAQALVLEIEATASPRVRALVRADLEEVLVRRSRLERD